MREISKPRLVTARRHTWIHLFRSVVANRGYVVVAIMVLFFALTATAQQADFGGAPDPKRVLGNESCAKCHGAELDVWSRTPHAQTFEQLHRTDEAKAIAKRLGLRSVKRNDACVRCHYTQQDRGGRTRVIAGVSCESCHGAARDWVNLHADYGGAAVTRETESPSHRRERRRASIAAGMNNPSNPYLIARQCLACHATPSEEIVDTGGHKPGSAAFDFVAWSQGSVRHNFLRGGGRDNRPSSLKRVRVMHVVGLLADLEASLRAVAKAGSAGTYAKTAAARATRVKQKLWESQRLVDHPLLGEALAAVAEVELRLGNTEQLNAAADAVGATALRIGEEEDGTLLAALDPLLPPPNAYK